MASRHAARALGVEAIGVGAHGKPDDGYGMIRWKQQAMGFADFGLGFNNPDFVAYAAAYGVRGERIPRTEDFLPTLRACLNAPGVQLIDVPVDDGENRIFTR